MAANVMKRAWCGGLVLVLLLTGNMAFAQSVGFGASPGRASYRPEAQWNNGPYYTTRHENPYLPRPAADTGMINSLANLPPFADGPHGLFANYTAGEGALYPYAQGFSAYSGFASWYEKTYGFTPTREQVEKARAEFFRSAPRPPAGVLPPLPPPSSGTARVTTVANARKTVTAAAAPTVTQARPGEAMPRSRTRVYRSSVGGP